MDKIKYIGATSPWRDDLTGSGLTWTTGQEANVADHVGNVARGYTSHFQMVDDGVKVTADSSGALYRDDTQSPVSGGAGLNWADIPAASAAGNGALQWVSDIGDGVLLRSNGVKWAPTGPIFLEFSTTKIIGTTGTARQQIRVSRGIPRSVLSILRYFCISSTVSKSGSNDACDIQLRVGNSGTASDVLLQQITTGAFSAANRQYSFGSIFAFNRATNSIYSLINQAGGFETLTPSTAVYPTSETLPLTEGNVFVSVYATMSGSTDTPVSERFQVIGY